MGNNTSTSKPLPPCFLFLLIYSLQSPTRRALRLGIWTSNSKQQADLGCVLFNFGDMQWTPSADLGHDGFGQQHSGSNRDLVQYVKWSWIFKALGCKASWSIYTSFYSAIRQSKSKMKVKIQAKSAYRIMESPEGQHSSIPSPALKCTLNLGLWILRNLNSVNSLFIV